MVAVRHHDDRHTAQLCEPLGKWTLSTAQLLLKMGQAPAPEWKIPELVGVKIRETEFQPRQPRNFPSPLDPAREAVEIVITLKSPMPVRAAAPVLYVGAVKLTESEAVDKEGLTLRFWAFDRKKLVQDAPIALG